MGINPILRERKDFLLAPIHPLCPPDLTKRNKASMISHFHGEQWKGLRANHQRITNRTGLLGQGCRRITLGWPTRPKCYRWSSYQAMVKREIID